MMLFRRDMEPHCAYCEYAERVSGERADDNAQRVNGTESQRADGTESQRADGTESQRADGTESQRADGTELKCVKRGTTAPESACKSFRYDPLKRVPPRPASLRLGKFRESDFSL